MQESQIPAACLTAEINSTGPLMLRNAEAAPISRIPIAAFDAFAHWLQTTCDTGGRLTALFPLPNDEAMWKNAARILEADDAVAEQPTAGTAESGSSSVSPTTKYLLVALVAEDATGRILLMATPVGESYPSLTGKIPQAHLFERVLYEENQILPEGHPWLKPVRFSKSDGPEAGIMNFYRISGEEVHEVAVGPIHAGVIECGHFRFQCMGEEVMHLEISLGYHHRGAAALLTGKPCPRHLAVAETLAGDSTIVHSWAYCALIESLSGKAASPRGQLFRGVALELERLANHTGDMGAIAGDTGFLPTMSYCGRLRGDWLNTTSFLCGSRFGRGLVRPGGVNVDADRALLAQLKKRCQDTLRDVQGALSLLWHSDSFTSRAADIGAVGKRDGLAMGLVGMAARASGILRDARTSHPLPHLPQPPAFPVQELGDVLARTRQRQEEIALSASYCMKLLDALLEETGAADIVNDANGRGKPQVESRAPLGGNAAFPALSPAFSGSMPPLAANSICAALVEGWRGEVCHVAVTGDQGDIVRYEVVDPSFHNWMGLAMALRDQQISDFPLCNKSFNLSYCGHDL